MSDKGRNRATQLVVAEVSVDFTKHTPLLANNTNRETAQTRLGIVTDKYWSAVNCPIKVENAPLSWWSPRPLSIFTKHTLLSSAHE